MPVDVDAAVIANTRLSDDYSVLALAAPEIAATARPGQFVMVKTSRGMDPLLRRPFSIFEVLRDDDGAPRGITILNKRIGTGTGLLYDVEAGARAASASVRSACRSSRSIRRREAWMVAGGVGLAPFVTLAEALSRAAPRSTLFYGARRAADLHCVDLFERLGVPIGASRPKTAAAARAASSPRRSSARSPRCPRRGQVRLYVCGPTPMMRAVAEVAASHGRRCDVSLEQVMGCGMGGCYSCVVPARDAGGTPHHTRSCIDGPVFDATRIVWDALAH